MNTQAAIPNTRPTPAFTFKAPWLRIAVHSIGLAPIAELIYKSLINKLTANPIQYVEQFFGRASLDLLVITLAVTPIVTITGLKGLSKHRRTLGLYTFFLAVTHIIIFVALDYGFDFKQIYTLIAQKPFLILGTIAGVMLLALAVTSFKYWMKLLGKNWSRLHKLVYVIGGVTILHYALSVKGSLSTLSGNIIRPIVMGFLVMILLLLRITPIKSGIIAIRKRIEYYYRTKRTL